MKRLSALISLPLLLALGVFLYLGRVALQPATGTGPEAVAAAPRFVLNQAQWLRTNEDGAPEFVAQAEQITWFDDESAHLQQAELRSLGSADSPWRLTAPEGHMAAGSRDLLLSGQVIADGRWPDGAELAFRADHLWVDTVNRNLHTEAEVTLEGPGRKVQATGLAADFSGRNLKLLHQVRTRYEPSPLAPAEPAAAEPEAPPDENPAQPAP